MQWLRMTRYQLFIHVAKHKPTTTKEGRTKLLVFWKLVRTVTTMVYTNHTNAYSGKRVFLSLLYCNILYTQNFRCFCVDKLGKRIFGEIPFTSTADLNLKCGT